MTHNAYNAWRRQEAYAVPMTEEGLEAARKRFEEFRKGYVSGIRASLVSLERMHSEHKKQHNFFLIAKRHLEEIYKEELKDERPDY